MGYNKDDELAINTIRLLAVCAPRLPLVMPTELRLLFRAIIPLSTQLLVQRLKQAAIGRCHLQSQLRPSRRPYGPCTGCPRSLQQIHEVDCYSICQAPSTYKETASILKIPIGSTVIALCCLTDMPACSSMLCYICLATRSRWMISRISEYVDTTTEQLGDNG